MMETKSGGRRRTSTVSCILPFISIRHTTHCVCSSLHLVQIGPETAPQKLNEDTIFSYIEGMWIQGGIPQTVLEMAQMMHG